MIALCFCTVVLSDVQAIPPESCIEAGALCLDRAGKDNNHWCTPFRQFLEHKGYTKHQATASPIYAACNIVLRWPKPSIATKEAKCNAAIAACEAIYPPDVHKGK